MAGDLTKRISTILTLRDDGFTKGLSEANKQIKLTESQLKLLGSGSKSAGNDIQGLTDKKKLLTQQISNVENKLKSYNDNITKNTNSLNKNKTELEQLGNKKTELNTKLKEAVKLYGAESQEAQELRQQLAETTTAYKEKENQIKNNVNAINNSNIAMNNTEAQLKNLQAELQACNTQLLTQQNGFIKLGESLQNTGQKMQSFGQGMSQAGTSLMAMSAPMVAFSGYAVKVSMDFESSMSNVQAVSGATGKDLEALTEKAKEMGASTSKSATESADAMYYMSLAGWDTTQILSGIEPILRLSEAGNIDLARASDLCTDSMSAMGIQVDDLGRYLDIVAQTQAKANTSADDLIQAYIGIGGTLNNLNVPLEESASLLGVLANRGIKGSEAGNALSSILINLTSGLGQAGGALEELNVSAYDSEGNFKGVEQTLLELNSALADCTQEQRDSYLAMIGGKTNIDTLNALLSGLSEEYTSLKASVTDSEGALNKMSETMQDNVKSNVTKLKSQLEALGIQIGEKLLPHVNDLIGHLSNLIEWFGGLSEGTQQAIVQFGLFSFGAGAVLKTTGSLTSGLGKTIEAVGSLASKFGTAQVASMATNTALGTTTTTMATTAGTTTVASTALGALSSIALPLTGVLAGLTAGVIAYKTHSDYMSDTVLKSTDDMNALELVIDNLNGGFAKSKEELVASGLVYKDFSENISQEFRTAVEENTKSLNEFALFLGEINLDNVLTEDEISLFDAKVNNLVQSSIDTINSRKEEAQEGMKSMFADDGVITESEQKVLDFLNRNYDTQISETNRLKEEINAIKQVAIEEGRALNDQEIQAVQEKLTRIKELELEALGSTQEEIMYAKNEFNARVASVDLESASALMVEKAKIRDEETVAIQASYDTNLEILKQALETATGEERTAIEQQITEKTKERDEKIKIQNDLYNEYLRILGEKNPEILNQINKLNGEILSNEDKSAQKRLEKLTSNYEGLNQITESGMYNMYNSTSKTWRDVYVEVDKKTGEILGCYDTYSGKAGGYTADIAKNLAKTGQDYIKHKTEVEMALNQLGNTSMDTSGNIIDANGNIIISADEVTTAVDGTKTAILELNGTPCQVQVNENGSLSLLDNIRNKANSLPPEKVIKVRVDSSGLSALNGYYTGTASAKEGFSRVNENGWELWENNSRSVVNLSNGMAYVPKGTKITNHINSVKSMQASVKQEVASQVSFAVKDAIRGLSAEIKSALANNGKASNVTFNNNYEVTNKTEFDVKSNMETMAYRQKQQLRRAGII